MHSFHEDQTQNQLLQQQRDHPQTNALGNLTLRLPARLVRYLGEKAGWDDHKRWSEISRKDVNRLAVRTGDGRGEVLANLAHAGTAFLAIFILGFRRGIVLAALGHPRGGT